MTGRLPGPYVPDAKDLTPAEAAERDRTARLLDAQVKDCVRVGRAAMWEMAMRLHEMDEENGWTALGFDHLTDWLDQPEVGLTYRTYRRLADAYRDLVVLRDVDLPALAGLDLSKVDVVLPAVKDQRVRLEKALEDAKALSFRELRQVYSQPRALEPAAEPESERTVVALQEHEADEAPLVASSPTPQPIEAARLASEEPALDWGTPKPRDPYAEPVEPEPDDEPDDDADDFIEARVPRDLVDAVHTALADYQSLADLHRTVNALLDALEMVAM